MSDAMTRHDYRECPICAANRPRFCAQYYETENAVLIEQVKAAIADSLTPGGVKATYEQLLDMTAALRATIEQQAQEIEAWRTGGVTEEILRKRNGWLKVGKGCVLVREDELQDLTQQLAAAQSRCKELEERLKPGTGGPFP